MGAQGRKIMRKPFTNLPDSHSGSQMDEFCARLFNFKADGTYVDIGSADAKFGNNTYFLDIRYGWRGLCVEHAPEYNPTYAGRKNCVHINQDALTINYPEVFAKMNMPSSIDFLSVDIDILDLEIAKILLNTDYRFKVVGIEHDAYLYGDKYRIPQRELFLSKGYVLACSDVFARFPGPENSSYEDWYLDPQYFSQGMINTVKSSSCYPQDIIDKIGGSR